MKLLRRIVCALTGHQYTVIQHFTPESRRVICPRCEGDWAMNDRVGVLADWGPEFEAFYREYGHILNEKSSKGTP